MAPPQKPGQTVSIARRCSCARCLRPQSACICQWVTPVPHVVEVLILQHPQEVSNAKGSARLLHLSLPNSRMVTGEVFDLEAMTPMLKTNVLLYPASSQGVSLCLPSATVFADMSRHTPAGLRLIVLDATWRKSRKMLYLNPLLQRLPRLSLKDMPASQYLIRRAHSPHQLSTLEATCAALAQLEGDAEKFQPMLRGFNGFVAQQLEWRAHGLKRLVPGV